MSKKLLIGLGVIVILGLWAMGSYNGFVTAETNVQQEWGGVETQYQRRFDLIPNLTEAVKGVLKQEQKIFGDIAEARAHYANAKTAKNTGEQVAAANQLESAVARLLVVMENYPQLKSSETVQNLMVQLEGSENRISVARQRYNEAVGTYNVQVRQFPGTLMAKVFGFEQKEMFKAVEEAKTAPKVNLDTTK